MNIKLNDSEAATLKKVMDFCCNKLHARIGGTKMDQWDRLGVLIADEKVRLLRDKLFPEAPQ